MKICRFDNHRLGIVRDGQVHDITHLVESLGQPGWPYPPHDWVIGNWDRIVGKVEAALQGSQGQPLASVRLLPPVANVGKIIGVPINYQDHIDEANADAVINQGRTYSTIDKYGLFIKAPTSLIGPQDEVVIPMADRRTDHEVELGIVIGRRCKNVPKEKAMEQIFGYCIALDMTVRGAEFPGHRKSFDTFAVAGPWITTADEVADPAALDLELSVNGERRQRSNTRYLINDIPTIIEYASASFTLQPGDIIMTGTPAGVGPVQAGDLMTATVQGLGTLTLRIARA